MPGEVEGSSKIHEDDGAPAADQPDDGSENAAANWGAVS